MPKKDAVITAVRGYKWEDIRAFAISLDRTGFDGDKIILDVGLPEFTRDCLRNRDYKLVPCNAPADDRVPLFIIYYRYLLLLKFLKEHGAEYRYILWVDAGDQVFQVNPTLWLNENANPHTIIAARENWLIKDETTWNDVWVRESIPEEYDWLREYEVICAGTVAGDAATVYEVVKTITDMVRERQTTGTSVWGADQAFLNYLLRKPFPVNSYIPALTEGWCATLSSVITENFRSCCGFPREKVLADPPFFHGGAGTVLTPDGSKPFVLVHQYNRDGRWTNIMRDKFREW